jgi:hypothetical protein
MGRIEEFTQGGKSFIYFDLSDFKENDEFIQLIKEAKSIIEKYAERSVYTITNVKNVRFDTKTKELTAEWTAYNKPYVKFGVVIGMDENKKIMVNTVLALSGRTNTSFASTKEQAIEWLLKQE